MRDSIRLLSRLIAWKELHDVDNEAMLELMDILETGKGDL